MLPHSPFISWNHWETTGIVVWRSVNHVMTSECFGIILQPLAENSVISSSACWDSDILNAGPMKMFSYHSEITPPSLLHDSASCWPFLGFCVWDSRTCYGVLGLTFSLIRKHPFFVFQDLFACCLSRCAKSAQAEARCKLCCRRKLEKHEDCARLVCQMRGWLRASTPKQCRRLDILPGKKHKTKPSAPGPKHVPIENLCHIGATR